MIRPVVGPLSSYASGIIVEATMAMIPPPAKAAMPDINGAEASARKKYPAQDEKADMSRTEIHKLVIFTLE